MTWPFWVVFIAIFVNGVCIVWNFRLARRLSKLDLLLFELCMDAFMRRELPAWRAWCLAYGYVIRVGIKKLDEEN